MNSATFDYSGNPKAGNAIFFVGNEIITQSSKEIIWYWLTHRFTWPE